MRGVLRSLAVTVAGGGLVLGAAHLPALNLAPASSQASGGRATKAHAEAATQTQQICPGPEALGIEGLPDSMAQTVTVSAVTAPAAALPAGFAAGKGTGSLTVSGLPLGGTWGAPATARGQVVPVQISTAQSALVTGAGAIAPGTVATQRSWVKVGDNRGLVTTACMPAAASSWLIAGGAEPGRRKRLVLTNPGPNPVTVDLTVIGVKGPIESPNGHGLVVGPHARTVVLVDAIAGSEPSPAVHVTARGGEVAAVLSDTWLDGIVPRGGDDAVPVAEPAREQVIAGLPIDGGPATLRVAVPGDIEAVVQARVLTSTGPKGLPAAAVTRVAGHSTRDVDLSALPPGAYAVQVRADVPVIASAMVGRRGAAGVPSDLAWSGASPPIRTLAGMALHGPTDVGLIEQLDLAATKGPASVLVTTVAADGVATAKEVAIGADSIVSLPLIGASSVWVTPRAGLVRAAVVTGVSDVQGLLFSLTPLTDLSLTTTLPPLRELRGD